jgi:hypothetical protein
VRLIDTTQVQTDEGLSVEAITAIESRLARGEQSLVYLNRRGYAPVLSCQACGWVANCPHCSVTLALHGRPTEPAPPLARPDGQGARKFAPARADWDECRVLLLATLSSHAAHAPQLRVDGAGARPAAPPLGPDEYCWRGEGAFCGREQGKCRREGRELGL